MGNFILFLFAHCSANITAHAVERMRNKCEEKLTTAVSQATITLSHDLRTSQRLGAALKSKLTKAEVSSISIHFLIYFLLNFLSL